MNDIPKLPNSKDVIREASKKLKIIEHQRNLEEKFFQKNEEYNDFLNKFEEKISKTLYNEKLKSSNINEKTFSKIYTLLEKFNKLDYNYILSISKLFVNKNTSSTQTDSMDESLLINRISIVEKSNETLSKENTKYKSENEILKKENEDLRAENEKLNKQYILLNQKIEEEEKDKNEINKDLSKIKNDNLLLESQVQQLNKIIEELKLKLKNYEEKIKTDMEKKKSDLNFIYFYKKTEDKITFNYLMKTKQINRVYDYLDVNDIANYRLCCKELYKTLNSEKINIMNKFYLNIIKQKNEIISRINKYDIKSNYLIKLPQLEQLIKMYSIDGKKIGQGLKSSIDNALVFVNRDVKIQLGIPESRKRKKIITSNNYFNTQIQEPQKNISKNTNTSEQNNTAYDSFFGGFKNIFGFSSDKNPPQQNKQNTNNNNNNVNNTNSLTQSKYQSNMNSLNISPIYRSEANSLNQSFISFENGKPNFEKVDEIILNEINTYDFGLQSNYEFDYNSPDDINKFLSKFLKSPFPVEKLTAFISKLCNNFSDLLFNSYTIIKEAHQLELVCKSLNERFKYYFELNTKNEKLIKTLQDNNNQSKNVSSNRNTTKKKDIHDKSIEKSDNLKIDEVNNNEEEDSIEALERKYELSQMNLNISNKKVEIYEKKYEQVKIHFEQYKEVTKEENNSLKFQIDLLTTEKNVLEKKVKELNNFFNELLKDKDK